MDWRNGSRQNATGSAFRGISTRGRGRGRGRVTPSGTRGSHTSTPTLSPTVTAPPVPPPTQVISTPISNPNSTTNPPPHSKPPARRGSSHQPPRRVTSLSHIDIPKATVADQPTAPGGRPQVPRRGSHNPTSVIIPPVPSLKLDPSTPTTPGSPRPKPSRKRSHNRTRSSSKASTQGQLSAAPSVASLKEKNKETPPHMALASAPPDVQSFDLRTNIDTLVERVRAMAMAGSAVDRDKDKEGLHTPNDGHIDWAGDDDDTLPDLDDWVRPKEVEKAESEKSSERPVLSPVEEIASSGLTIQDKGKQRQKQKSSVDGSRAMENNREREDVKELKELNATIVMSKERDIVPGKTKSRGKHGKKKSSASEASAPPPLVVSTSPLDSGAHHTEVPGPPKPRLPLVHPLPPKPQLSATPARGFRSRGPTHAIQPVARTADGNTGDTSLVAAPREDDNSPTQHAQAVHSVTEDAIAVAAAASEPQAKKRAFDPSVDWANAPRSSETSSADPVREVLEPPSSGAGAHLETHTRKRAFDPSVDWSKAPRLTPNTSPTRRSPIRPAPSPTPPLHLSSPPTIPHPYTAPPHGRPRGPFPPHNSSPRLSPPHAQHHAHTRSQVNSPERSLHRLHNKEGPTHFRAHSSPQMGSGTRTHTSRPVITLDALSRISRTLGVAGTTTPPRGQTAEMAVAD